MFSNNTFYKQFYLFKTLLNTPLCQSIKIDVALIHQTHIVLLNNKAKQCVSYKIITHLLFGTCSVHCGAQPNAPSQKIAVNKMKILE